MHLLSAVCTLRVDDCAADPHRVRQHPAAAVPTPPVLGSRVTTRSAIPAPDPRLTAERRPRTRRSAPGATEPSPPSAAEGSPDHDGRAWPTAGGRSAPSGGTDGASWLCAAVVALCLALTIVMVTLARTAGNGSPGDRPQPVLGPGPDRRGSRCHRRTDRPGRPPRADDRPVTVAPRRQKEATLDHHRVPPPSSTASEPTSRTSAWWPHAAADAKSGEETVILAMGDLLGVTDAFVMTNGRNTRQVKTIVDEVERQVKLTSGRAPCRIEGMDDAYWVLMDYGDFLVHVFLDEARSFYDLEHLWADAPRIPWAAPPDRPKVEPVGPAAQGSGACGR